MDPNFLENEEKYKEIKKGKIVFTAYWVLLFLFYSKMLYNIYRVNLFLFTFSQ